VTDGIAKITGKNLPISSIRVKNSGLISRVEKVRSFEVSVQLAVRIEGTLQTEFWEPGPIGILY